MTAAMRLHRDACLMQTNLDILNQYALALHGTASKLLQKTIGGGPYPRAEVTAAAQGTHTRRASVHMEALGLWRPSLDPVRILRPTFGTSSVNIRTMFDIIVLICVSDVGNSVGPDPRAVVLVFASACLHVKISVKLFRLYIGMVTYCRARLCWGRG